MNKFVEYFVENDKVLTSDFCGKLFPSWGVAAEEGTCNGHLKVMVDLLVAMAELNKGSMDGNTALC